MKFNIIFKTPYATDQITDILRYNSEYSDLDQEEYADKIDPFHKLMEKFIEYDEYITIEFDTETKSAKVVPLKAVEPILVDEKCHTIELPIKP